MKRTWLALLLVPLLFAGCARNYVMTLNNGARITTRGKPKLQNGAFVYKDVQGVPSVMPMGRVAEIAPASMAKESSGFRPQPSR